MNIAAFLPKASTVAGSSPEFGSGSGVTIFSKGSEVCCSSAQILRTQKIIGTQIIDELSFRDTIQRLSI